MIPAFSPMSSTRKVSGVHVFPHDDPRVLSQLFVELMGARVDCVNPGSAGLEQAIDKAAGRSAYVDCGFPGNIYPEACECLLKLDAAVADVGEGIAPHLYRCLLVDQPYRPSTPAPRSGRRRRP